MKKKSLFLNLYRNCTARNSSSSMTDLAKQSNDWAAYKCPQFRRVRWPLRARTHATPARQSGAEFLQTNIIFMQRVSTTVRRSCVAAGEIMTGNFLCSTYCALRYENYFRYNFVDVSVYVSVFKVFIGKIILCQKRLASNHKIAFNYKVLKLGVCYVTVR